MSKRKLITLKTFDSSKAKDSHTVQWVISDKVTYWPVWIRLHKFLPGLLQPFRVEAMPHSSGLSRLKLKWHKHVQIMPLSFDMFLCDLKLYIGAELMLKI